MNLRERGVLVATVLSGVVLAGCSVVRKPDFPSCGVDAGDKSAEFYLRQGKFEINRELQIGSLNLERDTKTGEVVLTEGEHVDILNPKSLLVIPEQPDGREYVVSFEKHDEYIRAGVEPTCANP